MHFGSYVVECISMEIRYHPLFVRWLTGLAEADEEIFGEVLALPRPSNGSVSTASTLPIWTQL